MTYPRRLGFGLGSSVVSLSWRTDEDIAVSRNDAEHPVSYVNIDGVNSDAPSGNLQQPVGVIAANPSTVYVADPRGVMQLSISGAEGAAGLAGRTAVHGGRGDAGDARLSCTDWG